tara:strand:- start:550 stop:1026 length:477 start_codon:yes stop_codon:yes gene_type:complete
MLSKLLREYKISTETRDSMVKKQSEAWWIKHVYEVHQHKCRDENIIRLILSEMIVKVIESHYPVIAGIVDELVDYVLEDSGSDSDSFEGGEGGDEVIDEVIDEQPTTDTQTSWLGIPFSSFQRVGMLMFNRARSTISPNTIVIVDRNCEDRDIYFPHS